MSNKHKCPECGVEHSAAQPHAHAGKPQPFKHGLKTAVMQVVNATGQTKQVTWTGETSPAPVYTGRNGTFESSGVAVTLAGSGNVFLRPVTSKGAVTDSCVLQLPPESIEAVIVLLQTAVLQHSFEQSEGKQQPLPLGDAVQHALATAKAIKKQTPKQPKTKDPLTATGAIKHAPLPPDGTAKAIEFEQKFGLLAKATKAAKPVKPVTAASPAECTCRKTGKWLGCPQHDPNSKQSPGTGVVASLV